MLIGHNFPADVQRHGRCQESKLSVSDLAVADGPGKYEWRVIWPSFLLLPSPPPFQKSVKIQFASNWTFLAWPCDYPLWCFSARQLPFSFPPKSPRILRVRSDMALRIPAAMRPLRTFGFTKPSAQQVRWLATPAHPVTRDSGPGTAMVFLNMGGPSTTDEVGDFLSRLFVGRPRVLQCDSPASCR
jgi:hypothetical protein